MSLSKTKELLLLAKQVCRDLRKRSTAGEQMFWENVRGRKFLGLKFYRQYPLFVDLDGHETFFVADFYCHERRLVIEIDGKIHEYQAQHDRARSWMMGNLGIKVVRFRNEEIEDNISEVLRKLETLLDSD